MVTVTAMALVVAKTVAVTAVGVIVTAVVAIATIVAMTTTGVVVVAAVAGVAMTMTKVVVAMGRGSKGGKESNYPILLFSNQTPPSKKYTIQDRINKSYPIGEPNN